MLFITEVQELFSRVVSDAFNVFLRTAENFRKLDIFKHSRCKGATLKYWTIFFILKLFY